MGVEDSALVRMRRSGEVVRVRRDAYVLGEVWAPASPEARLALRTRAVLAARAGDVATHQSALALHGLPLHGVPMTVVDAMADVNRVRLRSGLRTHPREPALPVLDADGVEVVTIAAAAAQVLVRHGLLAALVPLEAALHRGACELEVLGAYLDHLCTTPAHRRLGEVLMQRADARCESVGETRTRSALLDLGLEVTSQVDIRDRSGSLVGRVDLLVEGRIVVEFDGLLKYGGAEGREALAAEKWREDRLRALGYVVIRVTWADLERPEWLATQIRRARTQLSAAVAGVPAS